MREDQSFFCVPCQMRHPLSERQDFNSQGGSRCKGWKKRAKPGNMAAIKAVGEVVEVEAQWTETEQLCRCGVIDKLTPAGDKLRCLDCAERYQDSSTHWLTQSESQRPALKTKDERLDCMVAHGEKLKVEREQVQG